MMSIPVFLLDILGVVMDPPNRILDEGDEHHGRERSGHDEGFDDNDGPIHSPYEVTVYSGTSLGQRK